MTANDFRDWVRTNELDIPTLSKLTGYNEKLLGFFMEKTIPAQVLVTLEAVVEALNARKAKTGTFEKLEE